MAYKPSESADLLNVEILVRSEGEAPSLVFRRRRKTLWSARLHRITAINTWKNVKLLEIPLKVEDLVERFDLEPIAGKQGLNREVKNGYCGDLLSDVMANAGAGAVWLTIQAHKNIVGVAVLSELAGILLVNGHRPDEDTLSKADEEGIPILGTKKPAFETAGILFNAGIGGTR